MNRPRKLVIDNHREYWLDLGYDDDPVSWPTVRPDGRYTPRGAEAEDLHEQERVPADEREFTSYSCSVPKGWWREPRMTVITRALARTRVYSPRRARRRASRTATVRLARAKSGASASPASPASPPASDEAPPPEALLVAHTWQPRRLSGLPVGVSAAQSEAAA